MSPVHSCSAMVGRHVMIESDSCDRCWCKENTHSRITCAVCCTLLCCTLLCCTLQKGMILNDLHMKQLVLFETFQQCSPKGVVHERTRISWTLLNAYSLVSRSQAGAACGSMVVLLPLNLILLYEWTLCATMYVASPPNLLATDLHTTLPGIFR